MAKKKMTVLDFKKYKEEGRKFAYVTAYDYTTASIVNESEVEVILVGDSLGMIMLGYDTTVGVNAFVAMFFVCSGSQIKLREAATPLVRGTVLCAAKIAIGGVVFLSLDNRIIGSALFTIGLFTVCAFGLNLFTGKVCYALENGRIYNLALPLIWLGNLVGTGITALIVRLSRIDGIAAKAAELCAVKLDDRLLSLFLLSTL